LELALQSSLLDELVDGLLDVAVLDGGHFDEVVEGDGVIECSQKAQNLRFL
jgi:hypothetical protein